MLVAWTLLALAVGCIAGICAVVLTKGTGPEKVIDSREQPFWVGVILGLCFVGLILTVGALAVMANA